MDPQPFMGTGFAMLPGRKAVRKGWLVGCPDGALAVHGVLGVHANRKNMAWPSLATIARWAGISKSTVGPSLSWLADQGLIEIIGRGGRDQYRVHLAVDGDAITIWHRLVLNGIWASLTPTARKVYFALQAFSLPGSTPFYFECSKPEDWQDAARDGQGIDGSRHVHPEDANTSRLAGICGLKSRTIRKAMGELISKDLIQAPLDRDVYLLPNDSDCWYPEVVRGPRQLDLSRPHISPGSKRSLTARRRRQVQTARSVPIRGISPELEGESPGITGDVPLQAPESNPVPGRANGMQRPAKRNGGAH